MIKTLRRRFIVFNMLVISIILLILSLFVFFGSKNYLSTERLLITVIVSLITVFVGSFLLSKIAIKPIKVAWQKQLDFTADASHELRTPISVIQTNLDIVIDNKEETVESQMKWLENINSENKRMIKLVENLLTLSRADTNEQKLEIQFLVINEIIKKVIGLFQINANEKNITINSNIDKKVKMYGDKKQIEQLMMILIDNALKYSDENEHININVYMNEKTVKLIVNNTGSYIEKEDINSIFDRFYRVTSFRNKNPNGSGLGLAIAKLIVEKHEGNIIAESTKEKGTSFIITFPFFKEYKDILEH